jgi:hypothetical protein
MYMIEIAWDMLGYSNQKNNNLSYIVIIIIIIITVLLLVQLYICATYSCLQCNNNQ